MNKVTLSHDNRFNDKSPNNKRHDIQNYLMRIYGFIDLVETGYDFSTEKGKKAIQDVRHAAVVVTKELNETNHEISLFDLSEQVKEVIRRVV